MSNAFPFGGHHEWKVQSRATVLLRADAQAQVHDGVCQVHVRLSDAGQQDRLPVFPPTLR